MADKDANGKLLREKGTPSLWSQRWTVIRNRSKIRENVRMSLQTLNISDVARRLAEIYAQKDSKHRRKNCKVAGMIHVLDELTAAERPESTDSGIKVKGILRKKLMNCFAVHLKKILSFLTAMPSVMSYFLMS